MTKTKNDSISFLQKDAELNLTLPVWVIDEMASGLRFRASFHEKMQRKTIGAQLRGYAQLVDTQVSNLKRKGK